MISRVRNYLAGTILGTQLVHAVIGSAGLRIVGMGFGFLVGVQLARGLGPAGYGLYGLAMSVIALLTVPTECGLPQLLTREVAAAYADGNWGRLRGIMQWGNNTVLLTSAIVVCGVLGWLVIGSGWLPSLLGETLLAGLVMIPLVALGNLRGATLGGLQHIVKGQLPDMLLRPAFFSLLLFLFSILAIPLNPVWAMGTGALSAGITLFFIIVIGHRVIPAAALTAKPETDVRTWWSSAIPMALTEGMRVLQGHSMILFLGIMVTIEMVGVFRVASSIMVLIAAPSSLLNIVSAPIISRLYSESDMVKLQRLLNWVALCMLTSCMALTLPFLFAGKLLLSHIFGAAFSQSNSVLLILCVGIVVSSFFGAGATLLNMTGHHHKVTKASFISLLILSLLAPPLITGWGIHGAAWAATLSFCLWSFLMWRFSKSILHLDPSVISVFSDYYKAPQ